MNTWKVLVLTYFIVTNAHGNYDKEYYEALQKLEAVLAKKQNDNLEQRTSEVGEEEDKVKLANINIPPIQDLTPVQMPENGEQEKEDPFADLSENFAVLKRRVDHLKEKLRDIVDDVSEEGLEQLEEILKTATGLVEEEKESLKDEDDSALETALIVVDRTEGLVLDISGSIVDMKKRLRCRVKSCTSNKYCQLIGCRSCRVRIISSGFYWWKKQRKVRRCDV